MGKDPALKARVIANKAKKARYERAKNGIVSNGLSTERSLEQLESYIKHCKEAIEYVDSETGYHYLGEFKTKLSEDVKVLEEYKNFAKDSNTAFMSLYTLLEQKIASLESSIEKDRAAYNEGLLLPFEWI